MCTMCLESIKLFNLRLAIHVDIDIIACWMHSIGRTCVCTLVYMPMMYMYVLADTCAVPNMLSTLQYVQCLILSIQ